jgi:F-type H+-transporting ATPase subunit b
MNIDWFTFAAQIINFLILVGLLRWFLYGPIVDAMRQREKTISDRWKSAEEKLAEANKTNSLFEQRNKEFDEQRKELMRDVLRDVSEHRERLTRETRDDVERKRTEWLESLRRAQDETADEIRERLGELAIQSTQHTLLELADADLEELVAEKFVAQVSKLDDARRSEIRTQLRKGESDFRVRSGFPLKDRSRAQLCAAIEQKLGYQGEVKFEERPNLICGIQLDAGGYSIHWNVDDFVRQIKLDFGNRTRRRQ